RHQGVRAQRQALSCGRSEQRRIVAYAQQHIVAVGSQVSEEALDKLEFTGGHGSAASTPLFQLRAPLLHGLAVAAPAVTGIDHSLQLARLRLRIALERAYGLKHH